MRQMVWLVVGEGEPYLRGSRINIGEDDLVLGRRSDTFEPDIAFANFLVSRRHCLLRRQSDYVTICDLGSKHGTEVNGLQLKPQSVYRLADGDTITLAKGSVVLRFAASTSWDETMELGRLRSTDRPFAPILLDEARRECKIGDELIPISAKEWDFLWLLYQHFGRLVSYDIIKKAVWSERILTAGAATPDVGMDEINTLIYRLRRKLGSQGDLIRTVRGQGCLLDEPSDLP